MFFVELSIFFLIDLKIRITMSSEEEEASDSNSGQSKSRLKSKKPPSLMIAIPKPEFDKKVKGLCGEKKKKICSACLSQNVIVLMGSFFFVGC